MRRQIKGTALLGGSPFRLLRLSASGSSVLDQLLAGEAVDSVAAVALRDRLLDAGFIHPVADAGTGGQSVGFVVPVLDDHDGAARAVAAIRASSAHSPIVVVDDGSRVPIERGAYELVRFDDNRGPAAARNAGWRHLTSGLDLDVVVFVDADVQVDADAVATIAAHFADERVSAVGPRVRAMPGASLLDRYEVAESPLDLGPDPGRVTPGTRISYLPAAALAVRLSALHEVDGFDEDLRTGEDVDLVWRLTDAGHVVRYAPGASVRHRNRASIGALVRQRFGYGKAAASLGTRHGDRIAPIELPATTAVAWGVALLGGRKAVPLSAALVGYEAMRLHRMLGERVEDAPAETARIMAEAHVGTANWLARTTVRTWLPLALPAAMAGRRARRWLLAAAVLPALRDWLQKRPSTDPISHVAMRFVDDASYCAGVWSGARAEGTLRPLVPKVLPLRRSVEET